MFLVFWIICSSSSVANPAFCSNVTTLHIESVNFTGLINGYNATITISHRGRELYGYYKSGPETSFELLVNNSFTLEGDDRTIDFSVIARVKIGFLTYPFTLFNRTIDLGSGFYCKYGNSMQFSYGNYSAYNPANASVLWFNLAMQYSMFCDGTVCALREPDSEGCISDCDKNSPCYQQVNVSNNNSLPTCATSCPDQTVPDSRNKNKCILNCTNNPSDKGYYTDFCTTERCNRENNLPSCCTNSTTGGAAACYDYCKYRASDTDDCSCLNTKVFPICCENCTEDPVTCPKRNECLYFCEFRGIVDPECAHFLCQNQKNLEKCCANYSSMDDCKSYCDDAQTSECSRRMCERYPAWFQRDKCICDEYVRLGEPTPRECDVYCKYPFFNYVKCFQFFEGNDEVLCKYLDASGTCGRYCGSNESCMCEYVSRNYCQNSYCQEHVNECECRFGDQINRTSYCDRYCEEFLGNNDVGGWSRCKCDYLYNAEACTLACANKTGFDKLECQCTTDVLLVEESKTSVCMEMCALVEEDATLTHYLCQCYYVKPLENHDEICDSYCDTMPYETNKQENNNCFCFYFNDLEACIENCDGNPTLDYLGKQLCKCENGDTVNNSCTDYCIKTYGASYDNSQLTNCFCLIGNDPYQCGSYCNESYKIEDLEKQKAAEVYCERWCDAMGPTNDDYLYNVTEYERKERARSECFCQGLHRDGNCQYGCEWIQEGYAEAIDYEVCARYCESLIWPELIAGCQCDYGSAIPLCRSFCVGSNFSPSRCNEFCKNQSNASDTLLCRCYFDLDMTACYDHCNEKEPESEKFRCLCNLGMKEECAKSCDAYGSEGKLMEKARCLCREQIDKNACFEYCDLAFAGYDDSHILQERCKCDYGLGDGYCSRYAVTLDIEERLLYECHERGNKDACREYCLDYVNVFGNRTEAYKCFCEVVGDLNYCPLYCNSLNVTSAELLRCKCKHYSDNPSCIQYCATVPRGPVYDECECTLVTPDENDGPTSAHKQACTNYCKEKPSYMERVRCACESGLDENRCAEEAALVVVELQSTKYKEKCELSWEGVQHEYDCRNYCILLALEAEEGSNTGGEVTVETLTKGSKEVLNQCYCNVVKDRRACNDYCSSKADCTLSGNELKENCTDGCCVSGPYHACICEYNKYKLSCGKMCSLDFQETEPGYAECMCNASRFFPAGLQHCKTHCMNVYGNNTGEELLYLSCYTSYDKCAYKDYCSNFTDVSMKEFCLCHYEPDSKHCTYYCSQLAQETQTTDLSLPLVDMCRCVWEENNTACKVFCDPDSYADYLCYRSCDTYETTLEYVQCLCTAGASDRACASVCDEYLAVDDMDGYYECRCIHELDLLSCLHYCNTLPTTPEQETCKEERVYLGPGTLVGKGLYVDDYDFDDSYMPSNNTGYSNRTDNGTENITANITNDTSDGPLAKTSKADLIRQENEKKIEIISNALIAVGAVCGVVVVVLTMATLILLHRKLKRKNAKAVKEAAIWRKSFQRMSVSLSKQKSNSDSSAGSTTASDIIFADESSTPSRPIPRSSYIDDKGDPADLIRSLAANPTCSQAQFRKEYEDMMGAKPTSGQCLLFVEERQRRGLSTGSND